MSGKLDIITIDGPAGVGKSTVSKLVASKVGYTYLDTGAMYRGVGLYLKRLETNLEAEGDVEKVLNTLVLELFPPTTELGDVGVGLNGEDVSGMIRDPDVSMLASRVSALPVVRKYLTSMQQRLGARGRIVAEGRDTGTVVFPNAAHKFFLDARPEERAKRRVAQLREKGKIVSEQEILALTIERDKNDRERPIAPLKQAEDAHLIDTTTISVEMVVAKIHQVVMGEV